MEKITTYPHHIFTQPHLLGIEGLSVDDINGILDLANYYANANPAHRAGLRSFHKNPNNNASANVGYDYAQCLQGLTLINLFYENSTRTRASFELAGKRLGAHVVSMVTEGSSVKKGETLIDTAQTLNAMAPDVLVIRHHDSGAAYLLSEKIDCAVINAGDGSHEHPTQALLDALTILRNCGEIKGKHIAICGDILNSRVARSNIHLLTKLGAHVRVIGPPTLMPSKIEGMGVSYSTRMDQKSLAGCDVVMMLRIQQERMKGGELPSVREYAHLYGLSKEKLNWANPNALVMHPGPMNRGVEIDGAIADDLSHSVIRDQVAMGVAVRMACLDYLTRSRRNYQEKGSSS